MSANDPTDPTAVAPTTTGGTTFSQAELDQAVKDALAAYAADHPAVQPSAQPPTATPPTPATDPLALAAAALQLAAVALARNSGSSAPPTPAAPAAASAPHPAAAPAAPAQKKGWKPSCGFWIFVVLLALFLVGASGLLKLIGAEPLGVARGLLAGDPKPTQQERLVVVSSMVVANIGSAKCVPVYAKDGGAGKDLICLPEGAGVGVVFASESGKWTKIVYGDGTKKGWIESKFLGPVK